MSAVLALRPWSLLSRAGVSSPSRLLHTSCLLLNSNRTSVVRCSRLGIARTYPTLLVRPDGSTVHIRYKEPRRLLVLPVDMAKLSEEERRARLRKRELKRAGKSPPVEEFDDHFSSERYQQFWRKK